MSVPEAAPPTERSRIRRLAQRGHYDRATLHAILDAAYVCHVAFADEHGVHCIPTACWREGEHLYIHGSNGSRMLKLAASGAQVCVTITHLDGLVLARSAFNHSMNYRSAVIYGVFEVVAAEFKSAALDALMEHIAPGRSSEARPGDANELAATTILRIALDEAASKVSDGGPEDDEADLPLPVWAGVLPMALQPRTPIVAAAPRGTPAYVQRWQDAVNGGTAVEAVHAVTAAT
ncbi:pyridoxamine 5'-phosphate oxidase family protein [Paraburkholderia sp. D15]|uniref:pyridoxamine 5'-phosphate oxidase family protein n=1 Tax=Paraburkholderia sp. D15 TaxID=2880218 RepID=UPI00247AC677|nr:pyridoxamine 5'-phosphate oxidase family protein [Paraburkholderia sp. D15]WGS52733.1 pyridoxamine 5'-phosphate oxidase family protein [Paraburkholderia sp. D15]